MRQGERAFAPGALAGADRVIELEGLSKVYRMGAVEVPALQGITLGQFAR